MGTLTDHVTQLCAEIVAIREQRHALNRGLIQETLSRREVVTDMRAAFSEHRHGMASKSRKERQEFLDHLREAVNAQSRSMQANLAGVRRAWTGK